MMQFFQTLVRLLLVKVDGKMVEILEAF